MHSLITNAFWIAEKETEKLPIALHSTNCSNSDKTILGAGKVLAFVLVTLTFKYLLDSHNPSVDDGGRYQVTKLLLMFRFFSDSLPQPLILNGFSRL